MAQPTVRFSVIGINHNHIYGQVNLLLRAGAELVDFFAAEPDLAAEFARAYPQAGQAGSAEAILEDASIQLIVSAAIPADRAPIGIAAMRHGKDFMSDKPGFTTLDQLAEARRVQAETGRIYSICFSERFENAATVRAGELVAAGAIGQVMQTIGLGPHRANLPNRPAGSSSASATAASSPTSPRIRSTSFCSSPARPAPRWWLRRSPTTSTPISPGWKISATCCCAAMAAPATFGWTGSRRMAWRPGATRA